MSSAIRAVLCDLSGTLHIGDQIILGSIEALERLRALSLKIRFVTNTTKESRNILLSRLRSIGFTINDEEIISSMIAARHYICERQLRPFLMVDDNALEDFSGIDVKDPNAVLVGLAPAKFTYENMNKAFELLLHNKCPLIAIHMNRLYKKEDGFALGPGPFVAALEFATGVKPHIIGKPNENFFRSVLKDLNCRPEEAVMIGDDVRDDVIGAQNVGITGILVKTGKYRAGDENTEKILPNYICEDFSAAVDEISRFSSV